MGVSLLGALRDGNFTHSGRSPTWSYWKTYMVTFSMLLNHQNNLELAYFLENYLLQTKKKRLSVRKRMLMIGRPQQCKHCKDFSWHHSTCRRHGGLCLLANGSPSADWLTNPTGALAPPGASARKARVVKGGKAMIQKF